jgi:hypothetical protein
MLNNALQKPNGPVAAALLAGGIGCAVMGGLTFYNQVFPTTSLSKSLNWYAPVGTLAGKSGLAILAFILSWIILALFWRGREVRFKTVSWIAFALLAIGLVGTFPPFWHLFIPPIPQS